MVREFRQENFDKGVIDEIEDFSIPENAASSSLNWITRGDKIELSGGYILIDPDNEIAGVGEVTGLQISEQVDGTVQPFYSYAKKIKYLDSSDNWQENGVDVLGADADGEDISFTSYVSLAGYQTWVSSPNSSLFKIMTANPGSITDMFDSARNHKGYIDAQNSRLHLWNKKNAKNYLYGSFKDLQNSTVYTSVAAEVLGTGDGATKTFANTLVFKAAGAKRTCFNIVVTDGTETFSDNKDGTLTGDAGGTGTINYTSGVISVTFFANVAGAQDVTANYDWEDSTTSGLADFTFTSPVRVAAEGYFLPQNTGGDLLSVSPYKTGAVTDFYCIHEENAYLFSMPISDLLPTNQVYRRKVGMKNWRASIATGDGIYYIDTSNPAKPQFRLLTLDSANNQVTPINISFNVDLSGFTFDDGVSFEWEEYVIFSFTSNGETSNNRTFIYNRLWKSFDVLDYNVSCMADNLGQLWAGDSLSNNVQRLFTTFSANGALINNFWEGKLSKLGIEQLKKFKRLSIEGHIQTEQNLEVYLEYDRGGFVKIGDIAGDGSFVDAGAAVAVGGPQVGATEVGGGTPTSDIQANHYLAEFRVKSQRFNQVKLRLVASSTGYVSVTNTEFYDIKLYGQKNLLRYRQT